MSNLSQAQWLSQLNQTPDAVILDVRRPDEWVTGIIPGAKKLDLMDSHNFVDTLKTMDKTKPYFVYCQSGNRSRQACQVMNQLGFPKTNNLLGGMMEWEGEVVV